MRYLRRFVDAIDAAADRTTLARVERVLVGRYGDTIAAPGLRLRITRRHRQLDAPAPLRPRSR